MNREATTRAESQDALDALEHEPIIGTHTIGKLTLAVNHRRWSMYDSHGNAYGAAARTGEAMRNGIAKAFAQWMNARFGKNG